MRLWLWQFRFQFRKTKVRVLQWRFGGSVSRQLVLVALLLLDGPLCAEQTFAAAHYRRRGLWRASVAQQARSQVFQQRCCRRR